MESFSRHDFRAALDFIALLGDAGALALATVGSFKRYHILIAASETVPLRGSLNRSSAG